jgi:hypothetical protein
MHDLHVTVNNISDNNRNKAISLKITLYPTALPELGGGVCGSGSRVEGYDAVGLRLVSVNQQILCGERHYVSDVVELLAEYFLLSNRRRSITSQPL